MRLYQIYDNLNNTFLPELYEEPDDAYTELARRANQLNIDPNRMAELYGVVGSEKEYWPEDTQTEHDEKLEPTRPEQTRWDIPAPKQPRGPGGKKARAPKPIPPSPAGYKTEEDGTVGDNGLELVNESPATNALRYTVMRIVRIVLAMACEVASWVVAAFVGVYAWLFMAWSALGIMEILGKVIYFLENLSPPDADVLEHWRAVGMNIPQGRSRIPQIGAMWAKEWAFVGDDPTLWQWLGQHVYIAFPIAVALLVLLCAQSLALGLPYRNKNTAPGSSVVRCSHCKKKIADSLRCPECNEFRAAGLAVKVAWLANVFITSIWITHDALTMASGMWARGRK